MLTLIYGGSGSGKSAFAENLAVKTGKGNRFYVATMKSNDDESQKRIERHQKMRQGKDFITIECAVDIEKTVEYSIKEEDTVLIECLSNLVANEMFRDGKIIESQQCFSKIAAGIEQIEKVCKHVFIVSNDVFSDGVSYEKEVEEYIKTIGLLHQMLSERANQVIEVVYGIPVFLKQKEYMEKGKN